MRLNKIITVVIPCFKVSKQLHEVLLTVPKFVDHIIVIDGACPENSGKIAEELNQIKTQVIYHKKNQGVGAAMVSGYKKALELNSDIIVKLDGDGQMDPSKINLLVDPIINQLADYTKGNRFYDFKALKTMPKIRLFGNSFLSFLVKFSSGYWNMMDPTNGFTAIASEALKNVQLDKLSKRFFFETDMLIRLNIYATVVLDVPIAARYKDEKSNLNVFNVILKFPFKIIRDLLNRIFLKYYVFDFNMASIYLLLSAPLLVFGLGFGLYRWVIGYLQAEENSAGTIMLIALPIILGVQFVLQAIQIDIHNIPQKNNS